MPTWKSLSVLRDLMCLLFRQNVALLIVNILVKFIFQLMLCILTFFYSWVYQLDIYLVTIFFMFNMEMFSTEKRIFKSILPNLVVSRLQKMGKCHHSFLILKRAVVSTYPEKQQTTLIDCSQSKQLQTKMNCGLVSKGNNRYINA